MVSRNERLEQLRAEVKRKERNAAAKARRLALKGINVTSTAIDPRVGARELAKMGVRALQAHQRKLDKFTNRNTKFHGGANGTVISGTKLSEYDKLEAKYNAKVDAEMAKYGGIFLENSGMTVENRANHVLPDDIRAAGDISNASFIRKVKLDVSGVNGEAGLQKKIDNLRKQLQAGYSKKIYDANRKAARDMLLELGHPDLIDRVENLTAHQFHVLFKYSSFATDLASYYSVLQMMSSNSAPGFENVVENGVEEIGQILDWAESLPKTLPKRPQQGKGKSRS